jgi:3-methyl-2-oxobutanoate hydroxymethyltransferase
MHYIKMYPLNPQTLIRGHPFTKLKNSLFNIVMKRTILNLFKNKINNVRSVGITSYDYPTSRIINNCNIDFIIVGDTVGSTVHGIKNLNEVSMDMMLTHCRAVKKGSQNQFLVGDMPYMSYQPSNELAIENAGKFIQAGMDAIKLEGYFPDRIKSIVDSGTIVMSHLGLTPQTQAKLGGYRIQAKTEEEVEKLVTQARDIESNGASLLLLEAVPKEVSKIVGNELKIPVYGIGAGSCVDGQLVIVHDILGLFWDFKPKFIKQYINGEQMFHNAINEYANEVHLKKFPDDEHSYKMKEEELEKLLGMSGSSWKYD